MKEEKSAEIHFSTMFDLYALPNDFPAFQASQNILDPYQRIACLEEAFSKDINDSRFIPYIQLHEFETLLFVNLDHLLLEYIGADKEIQALKNILIAHQNNPELINTGKETAPSKQIIKQLPKYEGNKATVGAEIAGLGGIQPLKQACKHFGAWIENLENLGVK